MEYSWVYILVALIYHQPVYGLMCYSCTSVMDSVCGRYFRYSVYRGHPCPSPGVCALQTQPRVPGVQAAVVLRGCYVAGQIPGLDSSPGCRNWTNYAQDYTALYCFCHTDYCNSAARLAGADTGALWMLGAIVTAAIYSGL